MKSLLFPLHISGPGLYFIVAKFANLKISLSTVLAQQNSAKNQSQSVCTVGPRLAGNLFLLGSTVNVHCSYSNLSGKGRGKMSKQGAVLACGHTMLITC